VVVPIDALLYKLPPPQTLRQALLTLTTGQVIDREALLQKLIIRGYRREQIVEAPGQFAVRGGIIDIFSVGAGAPIRLELFDDEINSLRNFEPESQRSVNEVRAVIIGPAQEMLLPPDLGPGLAMLKAELLQAQNRLGKSKAGAARELNEKLQGLITQLEMGNCPPGIGQLQAYFYPLATLFDYFQRRPLVVLDDPVRLQAEMRRREELRLGVFYRNVKQRLGFTVTGKSLPGDSRTGTAFAWFPATVFFPSCPVGRQGPDLNVQLELGPKTYRHFRAK